MRFRPHDTVRIVNTSIAARVLRHLAHEDPMVSFDDGSSCFVRARHLELASPESKSTGWIRCPKCNAQLDVDIPITVRLSDT